MNKDERFIADGNEIYNNEGEYLFSGQMELDGVLIVEQLNQLSDKNEQLKQIILFANELIQTQHITQHDYWKFRTLCKENGVDLE